MKTVWVVSWKRILPIELHSIWETKELAEKQVARLGLGGVYEVEIFDGEDNLA